MVLAVEVPPTVMPEPVAAVIAPLTTVRVTVRLVVVSTSAKGVPANCRLPLMSSVTAKVAGASATGGRLLLMNSAPVVVVEPVSVRLVAVTPWSSTRPKVTDPVPGALLVGWV